MGNTLGFLVGVLVLGTSFPHLLKSLGHVMSWQTLILSVSAVSAFGGMLMLLFVPDGPYLSTATRFDGKALATIFQSKDFRSASFGYFGHMWELYTFWAFVPLVLSVYYSRNSLTSVNISFWSFCIIAAGSIGCAGGGIIARKVGSAAVAFTQLLSSGLCCFVSPFIVYAPPEIFFSFLLLWGIVVAGDSPQFSALSAQKAPRELVGSALTIVNCIGFSITIVSIQFTNYLSRFMDPQYIFFPLVIGPIFGLLSLWHLVQSTGHRNSED